jgi:hypothetical protein
VSGHGSSRVWRVGGRGVWHSVRTNGFARLALLVIDMTIFGGAQGAVTTSPSTTASAPSDPVVAWWEDRAFGTDGTTSEINPYPPDSPWVIGMIVTFAVLYTVDSLMTALAVVRSGQITATALLTNGVSKGGVVKKGEALSPSDLGTNGVLLSFPASSRNDVHSAARCRLELPIHVKPQDGVAYRKGGRGGNINSL